MRSGGPVDWIHEFPQTGLLVVCQRSELFLIDPNNRRRMTISKDEVFQRYASPDKSLLLIRFHGDRPRLDLLGQNGEIIDSIAQN